ncbi:WecB/TagA/CpsF family glycosyltransferase, partial [Patescibacteria group bacterium]|nr:WecB/TagA/CpsF family glycosyltransferase [Patescibacteria group bacterium]
AQKDAEFREIINNADLVVPDGFGLILASKIIHRKNGLTERISGIDLIDEIIKNFGRDYKIFLLGGKESVAKLAAEKLKERFPDIKIAGFFSGDAGEAGDSATVSAINQAKPDILFIAFGAPKQEKWIARNLKKIPSVRLAIGVGGAFDIISGKIKRAPRWMRRLGLEWLWRLIQEPRRIGRIYNATIKFIWLVLMKKLSR